MLLVAQFTDIYYFMKHSYSSKEQNRHDNNVKNYLKLEQFRYFLDVISKKIEAEGVKQVQAVEFIEKLRDNLKIVDNIKDLIYPYRSAIIAKKEQESELETISKISKIQAFTLIKDTIWGCIP